jgi:hypothetical protein
VYCVWKLALVLHSRYFPSPATRGNLLPLDHDRASDRGGLLVFEGSGGAGPLPRLLRLVAPDENELERIQGKR